LAAFFPGKVWSKLCRIVKQPLPRVACRRRRPDKAHTTQPPRSTTKLRSEINTTNGTGDPTAIYFSLADEGAAARGETKEKRV